MVRVAAEETFKEPDRLIIILVTPYFHLIR
jgi:hypothetical protein